MPVSHAPEINSRSVSPPADEASARPPIPSTATAAQAALPWFEQRALDAFHVYAAAKRELEQCRGELAVVEAVARGEFDAREPGYAIGSLGAWRVSAAEMAAAPDYQVTR